MRVPIALLWNAKTHGMPETHRVPSALHQCAQDPWGSHHPTVGSPGPIRCPLSHCGCPRPIGCPSSCCGVPGTHGRSSVFLWGAWDPQDAHHPASRCLGPMECPWPHCGEPGIYCRVPVIPQQSDQEPGGACHPAMGCLGLLGCPLSHCGVPMTFRVPIILL